MIINVDISPKALRETLCIAQTRIGNSGLDEHRRDQDIAHLQALIDECDRYRPLGQDGKHGDRPILKHLVQRDQELTVCCRRVATEVAGNDILTIYPGHVTCPGEQPTPGTAPSLLPVVGEHVNCHHDPEGADSNPFAAMICAPDTSVCTCRTDAGGLRHPRSHPVNQGVPCTVHEPGVDTLQSGR